MYHIAIKFNILTGAALIDTIEQMGDTVYSGVHTETTFDTDDTVTIRYNFVDDEDRDGYVLDVMRLCNEKGIVPTIIADLL